MLSAIKHRSDRNRNRFRRLFLESLSPRFLLAGDLGMIDSSYHALALPHDVLQTTNTVDASVGSDCEKLLSVTGRMSAAGSLNDVGDAIAEGEPPNLPPDAATTSSHW